MKLKRSLVNEKYRSEIDAMYAGGDLPDDNDDTGRGNERDDDANS